MRIPLYTYQVYIFFFKVAICCDFFSALYLPSMSWFSSSSPPPPPPSQSYENYDEGFDDSSRYSGSTDFSSAGSSSDPQAALRMALQQEQQKAVVQAAIAKLTDMCWDTCMGRPDAKLSGSEQSCLSNCADRYLDTSMFIMGRMQKQQQPR